MHDTNDTVPSCRIWQYPPVLSTPIPYCDYLFHLTNRPFDMHKHCRATLHNDRRSYLPSKRLLYTIRWLEANLSYPAAHNPYNNMLSHGRFVNHGGHNNLPTTESHCQTYANHNSYHELVSATIPFGHVPLPADCDAPSRNIPTCLMPEPDTYVITHLQPAVAMEILLFPNMPTRDIHTTKIPRTSV